MQNKNCSIGDYVFVINARTTLP